MDTSQRTIRTVFFPPCVFRWISQCLRTLYANRRTDQSSTKAVKTQKLVTFFAFRQVKNLFSTLKFSFQDHKLDGPDIYLVMVHNWS